MKSKTKTVLITAVVLTAFILLAWQATGGDYYTKFEVVEEVEEQTDPSDPLAGTGFYENETVTKTVSRKEFRLGLIPTSQGLFDKHVVSAATILFPLWGLVAAYLWYAKRKRDRLTTGG